MTMRLTHEQFRELAWKHGLAAPHQRQGVYEAVVASHGHHSPEQIYAAVRRRIPSISLATVYNNLRLFVERGLLREVTPHSSTLRVDGNLEPHHHMVCSRCKSVRNIEGEFIDFKRILRQLPDGFDLTQPLVEVFGICRRCRAKKLVLTLYPNGDSYVRKEKSYHDYRRRPSGRRQPELIDRRATRPGCVRRFPAI